MPTEPSRRWKIKTTTDVRQWLRALRQAWSQAVLLVAGNKAGDWSRWYKTAIPIAEIAYEGWLAFERKRRAES